MASIQVVVVNFDLGATVSETKVPATEGDRGCHPRKIFLRFLMSNPAFGGNLGQKNKLIEGQPNRYDVICRRNASVLAFHLWPTIFARTAFHRVPAPLHPF